MRELRVGNPPYRSGFQAEMHRVRTSDHGVKEAGGEKYQADYKKDTGRGIADEVLVIDGREVAWETAGGGSENM